MTDCVVVCPRSSPSWPTRLGLKRSPVLWFTTSAPTSRSWHCWVRHTLHIHTEVIIIIIISCNIQITPTLLTPMSFFLTSLGAAEGSLSAGNRAGQQPATTDAVSYRGLVGFAWLVHYHLSTNAGGEKVKPLSHACLEVVKWSIIKDYIGPILNLHVLTVWPIFPFLNKMKKIFVFGHQATETAARQPASEGDWQTDQDIQCTSCWTWSGTPNLFHN